MASSLGEQGCISGCDLFPPRRQVKIWKYVCSWKYVCIHQLHYQGHLNKIYIYTHDVLICTHLHGKSAKSYKSLWMFLYCLGEIIIQYATQIQSVFCLGLKNQFIEQYLCSRITNLH